MLRALYVVAVGVVGLGWTLFALALLLTALGLFI